MARCCAIIFFLDKEKKVTVLFFFFFFLKHKEDKTHKKTTEKKPKEGKELTFKLMFCLPTFGSHFCLLIFALPFHVLSLGIFFLSSSKKKKTIEKKKHVKKGRSLPSSSYFALSLLILAFAFLFYTFISSVLS
jgi:hypothetical protein